MERKILHIDMDAFFAAVEVLDNPAYRGKPLIVGGDPRARGVVSTCSYEARRFGVHSAMPLQEAFRRCPQGVFVPVRGARYAEVSRRIMALLSEYTPLVEPLSLDEAFLDLTGSEAIFGPIIQIGHEIVQRVETEIGLSASVGIAPNKFLAKLASDLEKPKGFVVITEANVHDVLDHLPVGKLWGVGPKSEEQLKRLGITTIGMIRQCNPRRLEEKLGEAGLHLYQLANGIDSRPVSIEESPKSIGHETTFQVDSDDRPFLAGVLLWLSEQVARRLRRQQLQGRIITLKIRDTHFKTMTKRVTLEHPTDFEEDIYREGMRLAEEIDWGHTKVRLIGISVSGFEAGSGQLELFGGDDSTSIELDKLHRTVDQLKDRYGDRIITKGTVMQVKETLREAGRKKS